MRILRSLAVVAIAGWLGIMAFFSFGVAPLVFRTIDRAVAGQAVAAVLPRYYDWGLVLCGMAVVACVVQVLSGRKSTRLNSSHLVISYAVFCLKKKNKRKGH